MKRAIVLLLVCLLVVLSTALQAQSHKLHGGQCPAHVAEEAGHGLFGTLHEIMAPAWHDAYPAKDYEALIKAISDFAAHVSEVKEFTHDFKTKERRVKFDAGRTQFIELVSKGQVAVREKDNELLYNIFPKLHHAFEEMAYYTLPLEYTHYESFRIVIDLMLNQHARHGDLAALKSSSNALMVKIDMLKKTEIPEDLTSVAKAVYGFLKDFEHLGHEIVKACEGDDIDLIREKLELLDQTCHSFEEKYI